LIQIRKTRKLRIVTEAAPRTPLWARTTILPAWPPAHHALSIDLGNLTASAAPRAIDVCAEPADQLNRERQRLVAPAVVDARGVAEPTYRGGSEASGFCHDNSIAHTLVVSTDAALPDRIDTCEMITIVAWPPDPGALAAMASLAASSGAPWGIAVPVMFPATTELGLIDAIAEIASKSGAAFLTGFAIDTDAAARRHLAASTGVDEDGYSLLFHGDVDTLQLATERHIAAVAHARGLSDFALPPDWATRTNWNAAIALALAGTRLVSMQRNVELGWDILRASAAVATLDKPLVTIAEQASLSIVEPLPEAVVDCLGEWLETGSSSFFRSVDDDWRLRRDAGV